MPAPTDTWTPVPHDLVIEQVTRTVESSGLAVSERSFAIAKDGMRMFGILTLAGGTDHATTIGIRNSHDKTFPVGLALGSRVFVCDNLAFSSEVTISTKHTRYVLNRLPRLIGEGVARLVEQRVHQERRLEVYKETPVQGLAHLHDLVLRCYRAKAIPARAIAEVLQEYEEPKHPEFREPTLWAYFNAVTEVLKTYGELQPRTQRLHGVIDADCPKLLAV
jgi:hypothetical protein